MSGSGRPAQLSDLQRTRLEEVMRNSEEMYDLSRFKTAGRSGGVRMGFNDYRNSNKHSCMRGGGELTSQVAGWRWVESPPNREFTGEDDPGCTQGQTNKHIAMETPLSSSYSF